MAIKGVLNYISFRSFFFFFRTPLVPVFSFGETDIYDQVYGSEGSFLKKVQHFIRKKIGIAPIILMGRGFFQYSFGIIAQRRPITVVGNCHSFHKKYLFIGMSYKWFERYFLSEKIAG